MATNKLNVGIIGAGRIGKVHAENLAFRVPEAKALAITDLNRQVAERVATRCGIPKVADSADQVLADPSIRAVLICSSTDTHADLIARAAQAGKHIFCEKPIAHSLAKIDAALTAVQRLALNSRLGLTVDSTRTLPVFVPQSPTARSVPAPAAHHQSRPRAATNFLRQGFRRHLPRHDHP
jgi:predicted dehydrogenase